MRLREREKSYSPCWGDSPGRWLAARPAAAGTKRPPTPTANIDERTNLETRPHWGWDLGSEIILAARKSISLFNWMREREKVFIVAWGSFHDFQHRRCCRFSCDLRAIQGLLMMIYIKLLPRHFFYLLSVNLIHTCWRIFEPKPHFLPRAMSAAAASPLAPRACGRDYLAQIYIFIHLSSTALFWPIH